MALDPIRERAAEKRADELISQLAISDVEDLDVEAIAMTQKALVVYGGLSGAEARLSRSPRLSFIRVNDGIPESGRKRFAIAHELGHLLLEKGHSATGLMAEGLLSGQFRDAEKGVWPSFTPDQIAWIQRQPKPALVAGAGSLPLGMN